MKGYVVVDMAKNTAGATADSQGFSTITNVAKGIVEPQFAPYGGLKYLILGTAALVGGAVAMKVYTGQFDLPKGQGQLFFHH